MAWQLCCTVLMLSVTLAVLALPFPANRPVDTGNDGNDPAPSGSPGSGGRPNTAPLADEPTTTSSNNTASNNGIMVNGFNCSQYISQCHHNHQVMNVTNSTMPSPGAGEDAVCENPQAQSMCGTFINNPVTTNVSNSTIIHQTQHNLIAINPPPGSMNGSSFFWRPPPPNGGSRAN